MAALKRMVRNGVSDATFAAYLETFIVGHLNAERKEMAELAGELDVKVSPVIQSAVYRTDVQGAINAVMSEACRVFVSLCRERIETEDEENE